jgi:hypothetical protein
MRKRLRYTNLNRDLELRRGEPLGSAEMATRSIREAVEQCFCVLQVGSVEAFGEPSVDFGEHRARLVCLALLGEQPGR